MTAGELDFLVSVGILRPQADDGRGYELAELMALPQPGVIDVLAEMAERRLPATTRGIAFADGSVNAQLGYALARRLSVPLSILYDREGVGYLEGDAPIEGTLSFVSYTLERPWLVGEFAALCEQRGVTVGSVVAIVDRLVHQTTLPVQSVFRVARY
jgi:hypothetical protein